MDADTEAHLLIGSSIRILFGYGLLHHDGTFNGINCAGEIGDEAVARRGEDPAPMRGDQPISDDPVCGEGAERANLVLPHQAAVALDIGGKDRCELSFYGWRFQGLGTSPTASIYRPRVRSEGFSAIPEAARGPSRTRTRFSPSQRNRRVTCSAKGFRDRCWICAEKGCEDLVSARLSYPVDA